jgi:hypothetical protein
LPPFYTGNALLDFAVSCVFPAFAAEFAELQPLGRCLLVLRGRVVLVLAVDTLQSHDFAGHVELLRLIAFAASQAALALSGSKPGYQRAFLSGRREFRQSGLNRFANSLKSTTRRFR